MLNECLRSIILKEKVAEQYEICVSSNVALNTVVKKVDSSFQSNSVWISRNPKYTGELKLLIVHSAVWKFPVFYRSKSWHKVDFQNLISF